MPAYWRNINHCAAAFAAVAIGLPVTSAHAGDPPAGMFYMVWDASNDDLPPFSYNPSEYGTVAWGTWQLGGGPNGQGGPPRTQTGWRYEGGLINAAWSLGWDCVVNPGAANVGPGPVFVDATINVTNTSASTQTFWVYMPLALGAPITGGTYMSGSVSAVVTAASFGGALFSTDGINPVFQGYIDTLAQPNAQMWTPGYTLAAGPFGTNNDNASFVNMIGPDANSEIAVRLRFDLSPGDSASVTGIFQVEVIPGPASLSLLALAGLMAGRRRRR